MYTPNTEVEKGEKQTHFKIVLFQIYRVNFVQWGIYMACTFSTIEHCKDNFPAEVWPILCRCKGESYSHNITLPTVCDPVYITSVENYRVGGYVSESGFLPSYHWRSDLNDTCETQEHSKIG